MSSVPNRQSLEKVDPDEKLLAVIRKHPFGIIKLYFEAGVGLAAVVLLIVYLLPSMIDREANPEVYNLLGLLAVSIMVIMALILIVATFIYRQSKIVLTDKTITQTLQLSLFSKKTSQLAVSSIEDVTAKKSGVFATILDFGNLLVETAGEQENFHFEYCPIPDHYAKLILETRQQFMGQREFELMDQQRAYSNANPQQYPQPQYPGNQNYYSQPMPGPQTGYPNQQNIPNQSQPYQPQQNQEPPSRMDLTP